MNYIYDKSNNDLSGFYIIYKNSAINEKTGERGTSHLIEHLFCHACDKILPEFSKYGIEMNAYTSTKEVVFFIQGLDEYVSKYKDKFLKLITNYKLNKKEFENEKSIILEEYKDCFNEQQSTHLENYLRKRLGFYGPIGERSDLENFTFEDLKRVVKERFSSPDIVLDISKSNDEKSPCLYNTFNDILEDDKNYRIFEKSPEGEKSSIIVSSKREVFNIEDVSYIRFICDILSDGLDSPLYQEIREKKGLVYGLGMYYYDITDSNGLIVFRTETSDNNVKEVIDTFKYVLNNFKKFITKKRFETCLNQSIIRYKKNNINKHLLVDRYVDRKETQKSYVYNIITYKDIERIFKKYFTEWDYSIDKEDF